MRVLQISSEATPFAKTGGLADVAGALPDALERAGCDCTLVVPAYREVFEKNLALDFHCNNLNDFSCGIYISASVQGVPPKMPRAEIHFW